ncbi:MAG: hypothetical protein HRU19_00795 [Pseudobacteriovorax sp.]|nr:hypothetical protein [Pseudobacteriovorax sp.]
MSNTLKNQISSFFSGKNISNLLKISSAIAIFHTGTAFANVESDLRRLVCKTISQSMDTDIDLITSYSPVSPSFSGPVTWQNIGHENDEDFDVYCGLDEFEETSFSVQFSYVYRHDRISSNRFEDLRHYHFAGVVQCIFNSNYEISCGYDDLTKAHGYIQKYNGKRGSERVKYYSGYRSLSPDFQSNTLDRIEIAVNNSSLI